MKETVTVLVLVALVAGACAPVTKRRINPSDVLPGWDNVVALPPDTVVRVWTVNQGAQKGWVIAADEWEFAVRTMDGPVVLPASSVLRVDRLEDRAAPRGVRRRAASTLARVAVAVGATVAAIGLTSALTCMAFSGRPCWIVPSPRAIAGITALYGGAALVPENERGVTVYVRP